MTTQNTPINLAGSGVYTNPANNTVITYNAGVDNNGYTYGITQTFTNAGTVYSTGTGSGAAYSGIDIVVDHAAGQNNSITNSGLISGFNYGIYLGGGHVGSPVVISNTGSIVARGSAGGDSAGIFAGNGQTISVTNSGYIVGAEGVFVQSDDNGVQFVNNKLGGTIAATLNEGYFYAIKIQDITGGIQGTGNIYNAGLINGFVDDAARYGNITNASTGTITNGLLVFGTGTLTLEAGGTIGGKARFADGRYTGNFISLSSLILGGGAGTLGNLSDPGNFTGFGTVTVTSGADWTLGTSSSSAGFSGVSTIGNFGTVNLAGALSGNTIDMEGSVAGTATKVEFTGSDTSTPIVDYGANDQIVLDNLPSGSGTSYQDSYNTGTGVLTVTEYSAAGASIGSDLITVSAAPGNTIAPNGSFLEISGPGGPTIVLGSSSLGTGGSIVIDHGESYMLSNTAAVDTIPVTFGTNGTLGAFNTLEINGSVSGTNSPYTGSITGFGLNDDIIIGPSTIPGDTTIGASIGASVSLAYSGSLLSVTELSAAGSVIGTTTLNVGTGYAANSFVALYGTNGINIETPQTVNEQSFTFVGNGASVPDFTDPLAYAGSVSPGGSIITGEVVTVLSAPSIQVAIEGPEVNSGTILIDGAQVIDAATGSGGSELTGTGTVAIENGGFFQQNGGSTSNTIAFGTNATSVISQLTLNDSLSSFASPILGFGTNDEIFLASNVLPAPTGGNEVSDTYNPVAGILVVSETNAAGTIIGAATLNVSNTGSLAPDSFVLVSTATGVRVFTGDTQLSTNNGNLLGNTSGSIVIDHGQHVTLTNTTGVDNLPVTFGSNGTSLALNVLDLNGTVSGTNSPYTGTISGFGLNDDIILGPSVLPSQILGGQVSLSYAGSLLSVTEFDAGGNSIGSTTLDVGTGYDATSFVALLGSNGVNIETPSTVVEQPLTFNASGTDNFETTTDYSGGLAPGSSIVAGETVIIASGTAAVSTTAPVSNSGTIIVSGASSGFVDAGTLSGNGTIIATGGASVSLATDAGTVDFGTAATGAPNVLYLDGGPAAFTGTIGGFGANDEIILGTSVLPAGASGTSYTDSYNTATGVLTVSEINAAGTTVGTTALTVGNTGGTLTSGSFVDISGPNGVTVALASTPLGNTGSIFIDRGEQVTLSNTTGIDTIPVTFGTNGTSLALNVLDLNGTVSGTSSPYQGAISGFGLNDDIILGPSVLPSVASGDSVTLSYAGSLLTVTELDSSGASIGSTTLNVGTGYAAGSFVALLGTNGVNIETVPTAKEQSFVFGPLTSGTNYQGDFETPSDYQGGLAPGATIFAGETVTVQQPAQANVTSSLTNNGLIVLDANNANMLATAAIGGTGTIEVGGNSTLVLANTIGTTTDTIAFGSDGTNNVLRLDGTGTASFAGTITGIGGNDEIDLGASFLPTPTNASAITLNYNSLSGVLTIFDTVGGTIYTDTLNIAGPILGGFSAAVGSNGIIISDVPCFAAGTRILTPDGEVAVERLAAGDEVLSARDYETRKIIWAGRRVIDLSRHAHPEKVIPVLIKAGAFGEGVPERDLRVSPDHALFIDGHLIEAKTLVNGATILWDRAARFVSYHHIELESHDVVLAEGLPAETYLDSGNRRNFEADAGPLALHPDFAAASREAACAPLLLDGEIVRRARQALLDRAIALGFTRTDAIDLVVRSGGEVIEPHRDATGRELMFVLPAQARQVSLVSAAGVPAELSADPSDRRVLGAAIVSLTLIAGGKRIAIDVNGAHGGFHDAEPGQRWTDGAAVITLPDYTGRAVLEVTLAGQAARWQAPAGVRRKMK